MNPIVVLIIAIVCSLGGAYTLSRAQTMTIDPVADDFFIFLAYVGGGFLVGTGAFLFVAFAILIGVPA